MITICDPNFWTKLADKDCTKLIAIVDSDWGVAKNGEIPWAFEEDRTFFKRLTENSTVIMGRKTFESIPNPPLKNRINCVISKTITNKPSLTNIKKLSDIELYGSIEEALQRHKNAWIIGGAEIYNYALRNFLVDYAVVTRVYKRTNADKFIEKAILVSQTYRKTILFQGESYNITSYSNS